MRHLLRRAAPLTLLVMLSGACGIRGAEDGGRDRTGRVITEAQIARSGATDAWDALRRVGTHLTMSETGSGRSRALGRRGASSLTLSNTPIVVLDGVRLIDFHTLQKVPADRILEIRILNGADGTTRYGTGSGNGVIVVTTK